MKIGILTIVNTINYGASLQVYALQQVIERQGHSCEIIKYSCEAIQKVHDPQKVVIPKGVKMLFTPFLRHVHWKIYKKFRRFDNEYCTFSGQCDEYTIAEIGEKYDKIIVGSDQVWNAEITGNDKSFFLNFIKDDKKKYSYAASVGTEYFTQNIPEYEALIKRFKVISVREKKTADLLRGNIGREDIVSDVDPTLLNHKNWGGFVSKANKNGKYILLYFLPKDSILFKEIQKFAKEKGCKLIYLKRGITKKIGVKTVNDASPIDFINLVAHAEYVISGSFHALCFSLIFHKEFYITSSPRKDRNGRLTDLLSELELIDRFVVEPEYRFVQNKLDYVDIENKLEKLIEVSMKTIDRICKE